MLAGIFVGGTSSRMGSPKGLLAPPAGAPTIVERWIWLCSRVGVRHVLVGRRTEYASLGDALDDEPRGVGPIGGLHALARHAGHGVVLALACDMPLVTEPLVRRLIHEPDHPEKPILAPRRDGRWEPLFARYDARSMMEILPERIARKEHSLQSLLDAHADVLETSEEEDELLADWDEPGDMDASDR